MFAHITGELFRETFLEAKNYDVYMAILWGGEGIPEAVEPGVFVGPLNMNYLLKKIEVKRDLSNEAGWYIFPGLPFYGVHDSPEAFLEQFGDRLRADPRTFVVLFTWMRKSEQPPDGGWRWHKWGEYLGKHDPQHEYLYDEPDIDAVVVFKIMEVVW